MAKDPYRYFKIEAKEILENFSDRLLVLEKTPTDKALIDELFRYAHTLKGSARLVKLSNIGDIGHRMEDYLGEAKNDERVLNKADIDLFFKCLDKIKSILECVESGEDPHIDVTDIVSQLLSGLGENIDEPAGKSAVGRAGLDGLNSDELSSDKSSLTVSEVVSPESIEPENALVVSSKNEQAPLGVSSGSEKGSSEEPVAPDISITEKPAKSSSPKGKEETIRVSIDKINTVMNLSSELVINKIKLEDNIHKLKELKYLVNTSTTLVEALPLLINSVDFINMLKNNPKLGDVVNSIIEGMILQKEVRSDLSEIVERYEDDIKLTNQISLRLQEEAFKARMLPASTMLNEMRRMVRDISSELGKEVEFSIRGGSLEVDKQILDEMKPPLMHLIRNSLDHGIESGDVRSQLGKSKKGHITVSIALVGSNLTICIEDDGSGIDTEKVKNLAVKSRLISQEQADLMNDSDAVYLILEAGLSTTEIISDLSGRGVGMDVVSDAVSQLRGNMTINSTPKKGTKFQIVLPQSLANLSCLLCKTGGERLLIPLSSVAKTLRIEPELIITESNQDVIRLFGQVVPITPMSQVLQLPDDRKNDGKIPVVVIKYREEYMAFAVERLMGVHDVVVKNLGNHIKKVPKVAGATILGDGNTVIIIDPAELVHDAKNSAMGMPSISTGHSQKEGGALPLLVVDDSLTTRMMEKSILESAGYDVDLAVSGEDALKKVTNRQYGLIISDVEMPGINGFELTKAIKEIGSYEDTPIVIVSSLNTDEVKRKGIEAGARAYIVKGEFQQDTLLDTISYLI